MSAARSAAGERTTQATSATKSAREIAARSKRRWEAYTEMRKAKELELEMFVLAEKRRKALHEADQVDVQVEVLQAQLDDLRNKTY